MEYRVAVRQEAATGNAGQDGEHETPWMECQSIAG